MNVTLLSSTAHAEDLLLFTKQTRLNMDPGGMVRIMAMTEEEKLREIAYMANTNPASWEFVDYIFCIQGVTRAFTHQFVRHRQGSYAQQSQRVVDMSEGVVLTPARVLENDTQRGAWQEFVQDTMENYDALLGIGVELEDARGLLPTNILTNIVCKFNLRALSDMMSKRLCVRTQGEGQDVYRAMRDEVLKVHPWAEQFLRVWCATQGTCLYPALDNAKCPIKPYTYDPRNACAHGKNAGFPLVTREVIQSLWATERAAPAPTTRDHKEPK